MVTMKTGIVALLAWMVGQGDALALGGRAAQGAPDLQPHVVMVLSQQRAGQEMRNGLCSATVIAQNVLLTAAHCVSGNRELRIAYAEGSSHVLQMITKRAVHPQFSGRDRVSVDLALVLTNKLPARFQPLPLGEGAAGETFTLAGYGLTSENADNSGGTLRRTSVGAIGRYYPRFMRLGLRETATLAEFAICTGDSGGPVLAGKQVIGVVSSREAYGNAKACGIIAQAVRIAPQRGWIDQVLKGWGVPLR